jgi:hypothetical protein
MVGCVSIGQEHPARNGAHFPLLSAAGRAAPAPAAVARPSPCARQNTAEPARSSAVLSLCAPGAAWAFRAAGPAIRGRVGGGWLRRVVGPTSPVFFRVGCAASPLHRRAPAPTGRLGDATPHPLGPAASRSSAVAPLAAPPACRGRGKTRSVRRCVDGVQQLSGPGGRPQWPGASAPPPS